MNDKLQRQIERLTRAHKRHSRWQRLVAVQAGVVALCTLGVLMMPAVAMEGEPHCGQEEGDSHTHTEACYRDAAESAANPEPETTAKPTETPAAGEQETTAEPAATLEPTVTPTATPEPIVTPVPSATPNRTEGQKDDAAVNSTPARAPAASDPIELTGVTITINDNVSASGCYEVAVTSGDEALDGRNVQYQWYKKTDGEKTYTPVEAKNFTVGGNTVSNIIGDHGKKLFLALDGGTVSDTLSSVTYKAVLKVDGTEYDSVWAECTNTTHQASVLNGSFEAPDLTNYWFQQFVPENTKGLFWKTTALNEEGGQPAYPSSTERENDTQQNDKKHYIEIIDTGTPDHKDKAAFHHKQGTATNGKQYAEINAGAVGALYQTIATIPGTPMYWSVDHSGRNGTDTMAVVMMPESKAKNIITQEQLEKVLKNPSDYDATVESGLTAEKGVWTTHSGEYTIPEGQYETRFFFMAVSTYENKNTIGNHIDNVWFSQQIPPASSERPYFTLTKHVVGPLLTKDNLQQLSKNMTFTVQKSANSSFNNPETVKTYTAQNLGIWQPNEDGFWTLSARISMEDQELGNYYRIVESDAELDGFNLTATDTNVAVLLQSTTARGFTFTNTYTSTVTLPETGGIGTWPFMTAGLLLTGTALALLLKKRKTNN